jgi:hypothetical protein
MPPDHSCLACSGTYQREVYVRVVTEVDLAIQSFSASWLEAPSVSDPGFPWFLYYRALNEKQTLGSAKSGLVQSMRPPAIVITPEAVCVIESIDCC